MGRKQTFAEEYLQEYNEQDDDSSAQEDESSDESESDSSDDSSDSDSSDDESETTADDDNTEADDDDDEKKSPVESNEGEDEQEADSDEEDSDDEEMGKSENFHDEPDDEKESPVESNEDEDEKDADSDEEDSDEEDSDEEDSDEEDSEEEDSEEEDSEKSDFQDEPWSGKSNNYQDEPWTGNYDAYGTYRAGEDLPPDEDIETGNRKRVRKFKEMVQTREVTFMTAAVCCCCVILLVLGIVLGVIVFKKDDKTIIIDDESIPTQPVVAPQSGPTFAPIDFPSFNVVAETNPPEEETVSPRPTPTPTPEPTRPQTPSPTMTPTLSNAPTGIAPLQLVLTPDQDNFIFEDGFYDTEAQGTEDSMLVQHGLAAKQEVPDAFILFTFDITELPSPQSIINREKSAILELTHVISTVERESATYNILLLRSTPLHVESLFGQIVPDFPIIAEGPSFDVAPADETIRIDITEMLFGDGGHYEGDQLFFKIENRGPEQAEGGDRFYSRESSDPPKLLIDLPFMTQAPSESLHPSTQPTVSPAPSTSRSPTAQPTLSTAPSMSSSPTAQPTLSLAPSMSSNPTATASLSPSAMPSTVASFNPSAMPSNAPSIDPSSTTTAEPSTAATSETIAT